MPERILKMINHIQIEHTVFGKFIMAVDTIGITLSIGFYGLHLGELINSIFPPVILVLTAISLLTSIIYKGAYEYRAFKKRCEEKKERKRKEDSEGGAE